MSEKVFLGSVVYEDYCDSIHCPRPETPLPWVRGSAYIGGWNLNSTRESGFLLLQITPCPWQVHGILEVVAPQAEPLAAFAERVMDSLRHRVPGQWDEVDHRVGGTFGENEEKIVSQLGLYLHRATDEWAIRQAAVAWLLADRIDDSTPRFLLDAQSCPLLREGFLGAYHFDDSEGDRSLWPHRILRNHTVSNRPSQVHGALQYAASRAKARFKGGGFSLDRN